MRQRANYLGVYLESVDQERREDSKDYHSNVTAKDEGSGNDTHPQALDEENRARGSNGSE